MVDCDLSPNGYLSLPDHDHSKTVGRERKTLVSNNPNSLRNNGTVGAMFGKRLSIISFAIPVAIGLINGLHGVLPSVPQIVTDYDLDVYFTQKPWNALGNLPIRFNSLMIGIAFLLPLGLLFSCVFFYFINKAQLQIGSAVGVQNVPGYPFFVGLAIGETLMSCFWAIRSVVFHTT